MFTGIIEELGRISGMKKNATSIVLSIEAKKILEDIHLGDSIAVNGVCLTVTNTISGGFQADVMHESIRRSSLLELRAGSQVNLERALRLDTRLGGHIVTGHVDSIGNIRKIIHDGIAEVFQISLVPELQGLIVEKGSIAVDGISLTVAEVQEKYFTISIIPHTIANTTLSAKKIGSIVNLETDILGKYIYQFISRRQEGKGSITLETLLKNGF